MNNLSELEKLLIMTNERIASLPKLVQIEIKLVYLQLAEVIQEFGYTGQVAAILIGTEILVKNQKEAQNETTNSFNQTKI